MRGGGAAPLVRVEEESRESLFSEVRREEERRSEEKGGRKRRGKNRFGRELS